MKQKEALLVAGILLAGAVLNYLWAVISGMYAIPVGAELVIAAYCLIAVTFSLGMSALRAISKPVPLRRSRIRTSPGSPSKKPSGPRCSLRSGRTTIISPRQTAGALSGRTGRGSRGSWMRGGRAMSEGGGVPAGKAIVPGAPTEIDDGAVSAGP